MAAKSLGTSLRVVSLLPSAAEIICLVAPHEILVGRSHEDDFPHSITNRPILTAAKTTFTTSEDVNRQVSESLSTGQSLYDLDAVALAKLKPDVVVTQDLCDVCSIDLVTVERIARKLNPVPTVITLNPQNLQDVLANITEIGTALGFPDQAESVRSSLLQRVQRVRDQGAKLVSERGSRVTVGFVEWIAPIFIGGHWTPQMIQDAGGIHPLNLPKNQDDGAGKSFPIEDQKFIDLDAQVVIVAPCGLDIPTTERELRSILDKNKSSGARCWVSEYLQRGVKIAVVDGNQMFNRPGPRLVDAMEFLVGFINDRYDLVPSDFPWKLFTP
ncbi:hypothetical protein K450DRAFT_259568 [Umbelopsis ramanniana AG]|uniref:Fe/B12 periplasmic-binding domain-containing protein n=1 Tax=Umbelopsis ramanniana AG TaxID=1314678 RepID=A0AAD5E2X5_UMBRA|nr:uncharacterized protein K450DRAFT_259568 [Umbelopsis ramanniana AG]KAI8575872.1 hypothetical protein K450DRAFT_259568 [Umbelopsis ramanniana AG]